MKGQIPLGILSGVVGIMGLVFGGSAYFSNIKTDIAVHENKITTLEDNFRDQDRKLDEIDKTLTAIALKLGVQDAIYKVSTSTTRSLNSVDNN